MAQEDLDLDVDGGEAPAKKSGSLKWIIIGVVGLLVVGGATFAALYFAGIIGGSDAPAQVAATDGAKPDAGKDKDAAAAVAKAPPVYFPMEPPFVVNFGADADVRFMQITLQVSTRDPAVVERVKEHSPAIRNGLVMLYSSQDPVPLNTREGKEALRKQSLDEVNKVLKEQTGEAGVESVFFTSFVMQ